MPITVEGDIRDPFVSACSENNSNDVGFADFASFGASNVSGASFESSFHDEDASGSFADFSDFSAAVSSEVNACLANISLDDANNDVKNPID